MSFYTRAQIESRGQFVGKSRSIMEGLLKSADAVASVFLSHSHKDQAVIRGLEQMLAELEVRLYIDWQDSEMPQSTSPETARILKQRISQYDKFIMVATPNALASMWVPWEIGVADVLKGPDKMAIWPITDAGTWPGREYLGIYSTIEPSDAGGPAVFKPGENRGPGLAKWLRG